MEHLTQDDRYSHWIWWINQPALCKPTSGRFLVMRQSRGAFPAQSEAPFEFFCWQLHHLPHDMTPQLHLISLALKGKRSARGERAPRALSIVDGFCRLPSLEFAAGSVEPAGCPLVLVAGPVPLAVLHGDAQNGSRRATTPDGRAGVGTAEQ